MRSFFESTDKKHVFNSISAQMLVIIVAFAIICISSIIFVNRVERNHLLKEAENTLMFAEAEINYSFMEPEILLSGYSETILNMLLNGDDEKAVSSNIADMADLYLKRDNEHLASLLMIHGYFFTWGGKYLTSREWNPLASFDPQGSPWYTAAVAAGGQIAVSEPYVDTETGEIIVSFSRYLTHENNPLGVICVYMEYSRIYRYIININITEKSYGMLLDNSLRILAHPEPYFVNGYLYFVNSGIADLSFKLNTGQNVFEQRVKNYLKKNTIVFFRKIEHGLHIGIVIPSGEYYRSAANMTVFILILGCLLAAGICIMLYQISQAKIKSDLRTQQKSNFLATMSHEIRTPLNAILGMTEIQMQSASHQPATYEAFLKINNSGNLLLTIINDILDLSKIEAGKLDLTPVKYEVASLINDIVHLNYIRYESKPIEFKIEIDENIPSILVGDELRIKQILNNLLSNAFKYTDRGTVTLNVNAECVGRGGGVLVTLIFQVSDTGHGMTQEQIEKLFDEYTRFDLEANRTTEGAGLGMTITQNLVDLMYGKISVRSAVGEGTAVTVRLPQRTDGIGIRGVIGREMTEKLQQFRNGSAIKFKRSQITHEHMPYGRVLIVDDVETNLYVAKGLMVPYGLNIDLATSGFEAVEKIKEGNIYDIVFMDHMMPKMDGIEATKIIRDMGYTRPIVALTANALAGQAEMFLKNGFDGFISKPIDIRQLNVSLNKLIRDKQPVEVIEAAHRERTEMDKKTAAGANQPVNSQLAEIFVRDAEKSIAVLENCLKDNLCNEDDIQMYIINVHAMKSALANIGKPELSAAALKLEHAGREKDINAMLSDTKEFLDALRVIIQEIKPNDEDDESGEETEEALALLREKLAIIIEACAVFDKKTAKNSLRELREKTWPRDTKDMLNKISEHLLHSDFENAAALADEYINK